MLQPASTVSPTTPHWLLGLWLLLGGPAPALAQVYCSQRAVLIDAPSNVRAAPSSRAAVICRLAGNGTSILVQPFNSSWVATMACQRGLQNQTYGLGRRPHFLHRSQVRLLGPHPGEWTPAASQAGGAGGGQGGCERLWQKSGHSHAESQP